MAPPKADAWPAYIFSDPAVETLDERGRFIVCGVCAEYYTTCGGKKPKPIVLNGCYRTRAWEVHKQRTRAHNMRRGERNFNDRAVNDRAGAFISASAATCQSLPLSFSTMNDSRPLIRRSMNHENATRDFIEPPCDKRRRPVSPRPRSPPSPPPIATWRLFSQRGHRTSSSRSQPMPYLTHSTLVFPLVRRPSELRNWSDFSPAWSETSSDNDWRRRPSPQPASSRYQWHVMDSRSPSLIAIRSNGKHKKAPAYTLSEELR